MSGGWVAFLTDYGRRDGFVAACHGVIARIAPAARVIDVTHEVPAHDIRHGAVMLAQTVPYLPPSVVVGVVDPGVGGARRPVAVAAGEHILVGPDNGLLGWAAEAAGGVTAAVELTAPEYQLRGDAVTFDGRDVFAPVAAHLTLGVPLSELGPAVPAGGLTRLPEPRIRVSPGRVETEAHSVDHFGNVELAARAGDLAAAGLRAGDRADVVVGSRVAVPDAPVGRTFADVGRGEALVYVDAYGHLAIAVNQGSAAAQLGVAAGDEVTVARPSWTAA